MVDATPRLAKSINSINSACTLAQLYRSDASHCPAGILFSIRIGEADNDDHMRTKTHEMDERKRYSN